MSEPLTDPTSKPPTASPAERERLTGAYRDTLPDFDLEVALQLLDRRRELGPRSYGKLEHDFAAMFRSACREIEGSRSQLREARAEADTSLSMLAVLRAEVASLTAIRERAETMKQVGWRNPRTGWLTNKEPRAALDSNEWEAVYVFGDAASGSDCASGSDTNPSPEPLTDVYDLLTDEQRAALREDLAAIARTRQVGLGAAPSPEPPRRCPVTQFPCATCPGECESVLAWRAAAPAPKEETR